MTLSNDLKLKLMNLTTSFEGGWTAVAGNGDGQILSLGPVQHNYGQGTLQPILKALARRSPRAITETMGSQFLLACMNDGGKGFTISFILSSGQVKPEWRAKLKLMLNRPEVRQAFEDGAQSYYDRAERLASLLGLRTERGLALCFDIAVQNGAPRNDHIDLFKKRGGESLKAEWERLKVLATAVADCANPIWRGDVLARKLSIALGSTTASEMTVHGRNFDVEKDYAISYNRPYDTSKP